MRAGATTELAKTPTPGLSQAWSRYFYEHRDIYGLLDGLIYNSAHNDEECIALYERARTGLGCSPPCSVPLADMRLRDDVLLIADFYGFDLDF